MPQVCRENAYRFAFLELCRSPNSGGPAVKLFAVSYSAWKMNQGVLPRGLKGFTCERRNIPSIYSFLSNSARGTPKGPRGKTPA